VVNAIAVIHASSATVMLVHLAVLITLRSALVDLEVLAELAFALRSSVANATGDLLADSATATFRLEVDSSLRLRAFSSREANAPVVISADSVTN